jgi:thiamine-monophosphate kinase
MLIEGRHFLSTVAPDRLGHKALAVNLSDLAACGARPLAFTLALALPRAEEAFLEGFARGMFALAERHGCELIGGDTTRGPLAICITVFGEVGRGSALLRSGARTGDELWVSGCLGDARLALEAFRGTLSLETSAFTQARQAMELPEPRVGLGLALLGVARSAIDVSDGLCRRPQPPVALLGRRAPSSTSTPCRAAPSSPPSRRRRSGSACSPAATTTSWCSRPGPTSAAT